jgi:hypothetical protein
MLSEDLFLSQQEVRVRYRFLNRSGKDVQTRVAFPLPDMGGPGFFDGDVAIPVENDDNFLGFSTRVDGAQVRTEIEQKAMARGVDRADWLRRNDIPLAPHRAVDAIGSLPEGLRAEAVRLGLADENLYPAWTLKTAYHWVQTFPAGRPVVIEHRYAPSVGATAGTQLGSSWGSETQRRYCVGADIQRTLRRSTGANDGSPPYSERWLDYILVTGANWKDPIGEFRLVVDKGSPRNLVSFCGTGVKKIGATRFEMRRRNWRPDRDISILLLVPY